MAKKVRDDNGTENYMLLNRLIWYVETHLNDILTLESLADQMQVTPAYLTRAFSETCGQPLMRYVWRRRLTLAAHRIAAGGCSVLTVPLDAGYGSPEAFARAFRAEFGLTPRALGVRSTVHGLQLTPTMEMEMSEGPKLNPPMIEEMSERRILGPLKRYDMETRLAIPEQWADYNASGVVAEGSVPDRWYGVCANFDENHNFDYLCGMEVPRGPVPSGWSELKLPAGKWARFATKGHISTVGAVMGEVFRDWLGKPGLEPRDGPSAEFYPVEFNGETGEGGFEVWMPVK